MGRLLRPHTPCDDQVKEDAAAVIVEGVVVLVSTTERVPSRVRPVAEEAAEAGDTSLIRGLDYEPAATGMGVANTLGATSED